MSAPSPSAWELCPPALPSACSPPRPADFSVTRCRRRPRPGSCAGSCRARSPGTWLLSASVLWKLLPVESQRDKHFCFLHRESPRQDPAPAGGPGGSLLTAPAGLQGPRDWPTEPRPARPRCHGCTRLAAWEPPRASRRGLLPSTRFWIKWQQSDLLAKCGFCSCGSTGRAGHLAWCWSLAWPCVPWQGL